MNHLLLIDPQNDFCDLPAAYLPVPRGNSPCTPALPVAGAHADMQRIAALIDRAGSGLHRITVTLDSHQHLDIGHPAFWRGEDGAPPPPFTQVSAADLRSGRYLPRRGELRERVLTYLEELQAEGRYRHMIWPTHCELGTWGHNVHEEVSSAYNRWEERTDSNVVKVMKGQNVLTEHYSAIRAEIPDPADPATGTNQALLDELRKAEVVYIAGEASSHCVKATTEHLVEGFAPSERNRLVLLTDCMSPVTGFEAQHESFLKEMQECGLTLMTSVDAAVRLERLGSGAAS